MNRASKNYGQYTETITKYFCSSLVENSYIVCFSCIVILEECKLYILVKVGLSRLKCQYLFALLLKLIEYLSLFIYFMLHGFLWIYAVILLTTAL